MDIGLAREDAMIPLAPPMITAARPSANAGCCGMRSTITFFAMRNTVLPHWWFIRRSRISRFVAKSIHVHAIAKAPSARALSASAVMQWAANSG
jgi:hypothetical protein